MPTLQLPPECSVPSSHHPPPEHVNEVSFAFLDGAPDTPSNPPPSHLPPTPTTPSLRAITAPLPNSANGAPTSVRHLARILVFLVLLGIIPSTLIFLVDLSVHTIFLAREDAIQAKHGTAGVLLYVASGVALCLASTFVCHLWSPDAEGSGIPAMKSLMSGFYDRQKPSLSLWCLLAKAVGLVCAIGGGLPVGWEGPNLHISCIVSHHLSRLPPFRPLRKDRALRMQIMACACAVGLASSFGTPIGGVLYALETTSSFYLVPTFWKCMLATLSGSFVYDLLYKTPLVEAFQNTTFEAGDYTREQLLAFSFLGVLLGLLGALFVRCVHAVYILRKRRLPGTNRYVLLTAVGIIAALVQYPRYLFRLDPRQAINEFFSADNMEHLTLSRFDVGLLVLIKFPLIVVSIGLPIPAGVFIPCFLLGSGLGRLYGELLRVLFGHTIVPGGYAVVGAAAFTAGVTRALSVAVVIFEVTGQLKHMVPTLAAVLLSVIVANGINRSLYDTLIIMKELPYMPHMRRDRSPMQHVHEIMRTNVVALKEQTTLGDIRFTLDTYPAFDSFPVIADGGLFLGAVRRRTLLMLLNSRNNPGTSRGDDDQTGGPLSRKKLSVRGSSRQSSKDSSTDDGNLKALLSESGTGSPTATSPREMNGEANGVEHETANRDLGGADTADEENVPIVEAAEVSHPFLVPSSPKPPSADGANGGQYGEQTRTRLEPDLSPLVVTENTALSQLHFMFVMLMPTHAYVLIGGILQGIVTRGDLVQSGAFVGPLRRRRPRVSNNGFGHP